MENKEIDRLIAEKVMGWTYESCNGDEMLVPPQVKNNVNELQFVKKPSKYIYLNTFKPSTDIRDAWDVVEKLNEKYTVDLQVSKNEGADVDIVEFVELGQYYRLVSSAENKSTPLAICMSALKSVGVEVSE